MTYEGLIKDYSRKPLRLQAVQLTAGNAEMVSIWCGGQLDEDIKPGDPTDIRITVLVPNVERPHRATIGDFVVKGQNGRFYVEKGAAFLDDFDDDSRATIKEVDPKGSNLVSSFTPHYVPRGKHPFGQ